MVIMALDHTREFFHAESQQFQPDDLTKTTAAIFFTRWITHICAPVFMFAAGAAAFLWLQNGRAKSELSSYLWKRGLWLVVLELTALRFALAFSLTTGPVLLTVLWALGWSMVALGFLSRLPVRPLAVLSLLTIALHNLADPVSSGNFLWRVLHQQGAAVFGPVVVIVGYPLIPWIAVMSAGYCFGTVLPMPAEARRRWLLRTGLGLTAAFVVLRAINVYGDPQPWSTLTLLSFLRTTKYPPSLEFLSMTLGPALLLLRMFYKLELPKSNPLVMIGRVPLFYFLVHFFLIHVLTIPLAWKRYGWAGIPWSPFAFPPGYGYPLWTVYLIWVLVVAIMYPLCVWFGNVKRDSHNPWLGYL